MEREDYLRREQPKRSSLWTYNSDHTWIRSLPRASEAYLDHSRVEALVRRDMSISFSFLDSSSTEKPGVPRPVTLESRRASPLL